MARFLDYNVGWEVASKDRSLQFYNGWQELVNSCCHNSSLLEHPWPLTQVPGAPPHSVQNRQEASRVP